MRLSNSCVCVCVYDYFHSTTSGIWSDASTAEITLGLETLMKHFQELMKGTVCRSYL